MSELKNTTKAALAAALGALCAYGVQLLAPVLVLVVVMLLDYATGMAKAWNAGELSSRVGLRGILKRWGMWPLSAWPPWWTGCCATEPAPWAGTGR